MILMECWYYHHIIWHFWSLFSVVKRVLIAFNFFVNCSTPKYHIWWGAAYINLSSVLHFTFAFLLLDMLFCVIWVHATIYIMGICMAGDAHAGKSHLVVLGAYGRCLGGTKLVIYFGCLQDLTIFNGSISNMIVAIWFWTRGMCP